MGEIYTNEQLSRMVDAISETLNDKVDIGYGNTRPKQPVTLEQVTNCILEDPQNIKLELNNGTLTLKAGSVVCVPNGFNADGTPRFDEYTIPNDVSVKQGGYSGSVPRMVAYSKTNNDFITYGVCESGGTTPTGVTGNMLFYNTTSNKVINIATGTVTQDVCSFPICISTNDTYNLYATLDQTFQSIGYIGSTVFIRKGLKVLIPNGRNADGTLNNIEATTNKVITTTWTSGSTDFYLGIDGNAITADNVYFYSQEGYPPATNYVWYNPVANDMHSSYPFFQKVTTALVCHGHRTDGKIDWVEPFTATNTLKYSDKALISGWGMPSGRYIDLELGASGTTYVAPANGWFVLSKTLGTANAYLSIHNQANGINSTATSAIASSVCRAFTPVVRGGSVYVTYNATGATTYFRFVYAEGSQP